MTASAVAVCPKTDFIHHFIYTKILPIYFALDVGLENTDFI